MDFQTFVTIIVFTNLFSMMAIMIAVELKECHGKHKCDDCKAPLKKYPEFHKFDARHGGQYKDGKTYNVCTKCLIKNLKKYLLNFKHRA
ncbi:MAG: hypothetical protein WA063_05465, partial [Minisyncoccia bacterium]